MNKVLKNALLQLKFFFTLVIITVAFSLFFLLSIPTIFEVAEYNDWDISLVRFAINFTFFAFITWLMYWILGSDIRLLLQKRKLMKTHYFETQSKECCKMNTLKLDTVEFLECKKCTTRYLIN